MKLIGMNLGEAIIELKKTGQRFVVNEDPPSEAYVNIVTSGNRVSKVVSHNKTRIKSICYQESKQGINLLEY